MSYGTNTNSPQGFQPSQYYSGALWNGQTADYSVISGYATSLFRGDPVAWDTNGTIRRAVTGDAHPIIGVFWGIFYTDTNGIVQFQNSWSANTVTQGALNATAHVIDDLNVLYDIATSTLNNQPGPANAPSVLQTDLGNNIDFAIATAANSFNVLPAGSIAAGTTPAANPQSGNTTSGNSAYFADYNSIGVGATKQLKIIRFTPVPGNGPGGATGPFFQNILVKINNDTYAGGTGTLGQAS